MHDDENHKFSRAGFGCLWTQHSSSFIPAVTVFVQFIWTLAFNFEQIALWNHLAFSLNSLTLREWETWNFLLTYSGMYSSDGWLNPRMGWSNFGCWQKAPCGYKAASIWINACKNCTAKIWCPTFQRPHLLEKFHSASITVTVAMATV